MKVSTLGAAALALASLTALGVVACSSDGASDAATDTSADDDGGTATAPAPYRGPTTGGALPTGIPDGGTLPPPALGDVDADTRCCEVELAISDPGDAGTALVLGDFGPLAGGGVTMTRDGARFRARVCLPVGATIRYAFYLDPGDAEAPASTYDPALPSEPDGLGGSVNVFGPVDDCAAIDASTAHLP